MKCPDLKKFQSKYKGQKRFEHAVNCLGGDVVRRILSYSLYILGYPYDFISNITGFSKAGLKAFVHQINTDGIGRFHDKRRNKDYSCLFLKDKDDDHSNVASVKYIEHDDIYTSFEIQGKISLKIKKDDILGKKLLTLLFMEADLLKQKDVARIMKCQRLAVRKNLMKFRTSGTKGLSDNRGQKNDYKYTDEVKGEILKSFITKVFNMETPTKTNINKHLNKKLLQNFSERATALHLKKLGLIGNKKELIALIVRLTNERIDLLEYLEIEGKHLGAEYERYIKTVRRFRDEMIEYCFPDEKMSLNFFQIEEKVENFQMELQVIILDSILDRIEENFSQCQNCRSSNVVIYKSSSTSERKSNCAIKTGLGGNLFLRSRLLQRRKCNICGCEFDVFRDVLKLSGKSKLTPLAQKKICSANRACSYENAVRNLKELTNIDLNKNQVRIISDHVGRYIENEFDQLYKDIKRGESPEIISQKHPLTEELRIDKKYLDTSKYLIVLSADGGRILLYNWIPPVDQLSKAKKNMSWHETKVFRISIYDKTNLCDVSGSKDDADADIGVNKTYQSAPIISGLSTYGATNKEWKETGKLIISHLYMRGLKPENIEVCISDGSDHIMQKIFLPFFPKAIHILDYYHKIEALHKCLKAIGETENLIFKRLKSYLWEGEISEIITYLKNIQKNTGKPDKGKKRKPDDPKVILDNLINHLSVNKNRLQYKKYRSLKYPIGSGSVESAVKLFGKRIKGTEKQWADGEPILHLYAFLLSEDERWNKLWEINIPWM